VGSWPADGGFWCAARGPELAPSWNGSVERQRKGGFTMKHLDNESGRVGYLVLYFMGVPIGMILLLWVIFGNNLLTPG
jgi:hypothetical protein